MAKVTGRTDDMMIVRGVNVFPSQIEEQILRVPGLAPHYVCVLTRPGRMDELTIRVEAAAGGGGREFAVLATALADRVKQAVGLSVAVDVRQPRTLPRSTGKAKRIEDLRTPPG